MSQLDVSYEEVRAGSLTLERYLAAAAAVPAWALIAGHIAQEFGKGFGAGVAAAVMDRLFGSNEQYLTLSAAALEQIRQVINQALQHQEFKGVLDRINGVSIEMGEWRRSPATHEGAPKECVRILNFEVIPALMRFGPTALGAYVCAINAKVAIFNLDEAERANAKATLVEAEARVRQWIPEAEKLFIDSLGYQWSQKTKAHTPHPGTHAPYLHYYWILEQHGKRVWTGTLTTDKAAAQREVEKEVDGRFIAEKEAKLNQPFLHAVRETVEHWKKAHEAL